MFADQRPNANLLSHANWEGSHLFPFDSQVQANKALLQAHVDYTVKWACSHPLLCTYLPCFWDHPVLRSQDLSTVLNSIGPCASPVGNCRCFILWSLLTCTPNSSELIWVLGRAPTLAISSLSFSYLRDCGPDSSESAASSLTTSLTSSYHWNDFYLMENFASHSWVSKPKRSTEKISLRR